VGASPDCRIGLLSLGDCLADPVGGGRPTPAERRRAIVESAVLAEQLGFDSVWLGERPFCDSVLAAPAIVLAAIAARTERLRLGAGVALRADLDPVRVAEDYASLDGISNGRVELVAGGGILADDQEAFGPHTGDSRDRFREQLILLRRLWTETGVTWRGRVRAPLEQATVEPRPVQRPHPPLWVGGASSPEAVDLAAELGLPLMLPSAPAPPERFLPLVERYRERAARAGRIARVGACSPVHVGANGDAARERWRPYYASALRFLDHAWQRPELVHPRAGVELDAEGMLGGAAVCGSAAEVGERLLATRARLGLDVHLLIFDLGGLPEPAVREALERFGADVLPALRAS
jgi:alkanesulfonate monooxygenase SsuD/methylene tetrahydromethanopterin reductase-like flavin-dependent oxidoreductase (luciferase family)